MLKLLPPKTTQKTTINLDGMTGDSGPDLASHSDSITPASAIAQHPEMSASA